MCSQHTCTPRLDLDFIYLDKGGILTLCISKCLWCTAATSQLMPHVFCVHRLVCCSWQREQISSLDALAPWARGQESFSNAWRQRGVCNNLTAKVAATSASWLVLEEFGAWSVLQGMGQQCLRELMVPIRVPAGLEVCKNASRTSALGSKQSVGHTW